MSGLWLLALIAIWTFAGWALFRLWRRWKPTNLTRKIVHVAIGLLLFSLWFGSPFWEVAGKKMYWDAQVRELCALDGGVKVYETVVLPAEVFDEYGNVGLKNNNYAEPSDQFYYEIDQFIMKRKDPQITKYTTRVFRRIDGKVLGISIRYGRGGGDLSGPWESSTYTCPPITRGEKNIENSIFIKGDER